MRVVARTRTPAPACLPLACRRFAAPLCAAAAAAGPLSALVGRMKNWMLNFIQVGGWIDWLVRVGRWLGGPIGQRSAGWDVDCASGASFCLLTA